MYAGTERVQHFLPRIAAERVDIAGQRLELRQIVIRQTPFFTLVHLDRSPSPEAPRVLVVEPLSGIRAPLLFDMLSHLAASYDVYVLVWTDPAAIPLAAGEFGLEDNIDAVVYALQHLGAGVHAIGLCQSALPVLAAAAILSASGVSALPASIALLGGKLDTTIRPTNVDRLVQRYSLDWFSRNVITPVPSYRAGAGRLVYSAELQSCALFSYISRHMLTGGEVFRKIMNDDGDDPATHPFIGLLSPAALPGAFFLDTVRSTFHENLLAHGRLRWRGLPVDPAAIHNIALMTVEAGEDDISAPGQTFIAQALCTNLPAELRQHHGEPGIGHFGLFHGGAWRRSILPRLTAFFAEAGRRHALAPPQPGIDARQSQEREAPVTSAASETEGLGT